MKVAVIGGGPAGMIAAGTAASVDGVSVTLFERNEKLGKKLYITGKGRCNLTNNVDNSTFINNVVTNGKFLYSSLQAFDTQRCIEFFNDLGLPTKVERGNRVFPTSDKASDVTKALTKYLNKNNVEILLNSKVDKLQVDSLGVNITFNGAIRRFDKVIIATGGISYSMTGSSGDGYNWASNLGHNIIDLKPSLVGVVTRERLGLQGLTLKNINATAICGGKVIASEFGEMLFTHDGVSGPIILTLSSKINRLCDKCILDIDLKPALSVEQLSDRLVRDFTKLSNKQFGNYATSLLPQRMICSIINGTEINLDTQLNNITQAQRKKLVNNLKHFCLHIDKLNDIDTAVVTSGGVDCKQVYSATLKSKLNDRVYFVGEVLDVDALTGGFNIQIALSTGYLAGLSVAKD